jgi:hypothetical protein
MSPYLLFGFAVAGLLSVLVSPERVERHLGGKGLGPVVKASLFGVPLPLCSCGVIPVSASLRRHGASRGATASFLLSTPQTGADSIAVTYGLLGGVFAIYRPILALISGVVGGGLISAFGLSPSAAAAEGAAKEEPCREACCAEEGGSWIVKVLRYGFLTLPRDIGPALLAGVAIAALITAALPPDALGSYLGRGPLSVLALMALGIPIYVCATASVPVAWGLIVAGVSPGAAFAFLVTGPATNAATLAVIWRVLGRRTAILYLSTVAVTAFGGGLLLDALLPPGQLGEAMQHGHWTLPMSVKIGSAVVLLGILAVAIWTGRHGHGHDEEHEHEHGEGAAPGEQTAMQLQIEGMTCSHCADSVRRALMECHGVEEATVDVGGTAVVAGKDLRRPALRQAVTDLGYGVASGDADAAEQE